MYRYAVPDHGRMNCRNMSLGSNNNNNNNNNVYFSVLCSCGLDRQPSLATVVRLLCSSAYIYIYIYIFIFIVSYSHDAVLTAAKSYICLYTLNIPRIDNVSGTRCR